MADPAAALARECAVFARYLVGQAPPPAVTAAYVDFHARCATRLPAKRRVDGMLLGFARLGTGATRIADAYAARLRRTTRLQSKLVLVLALLECCPPAFEVLEVPGAGGRTLARTRLVVRGAVEGLCVLLGVLILGPPHLLLSLRPESSS